MTRRFVHLTGCLALMSLADLQLLAGQKEGTGGICVPANERAGRRFGCFIIASQPIGKVDSGRAFWDLEIFSSRVAAESAATPRSTVVESFGKVWLFTIAPAGWRARGGTHVAEIGPIPVAASVNYRAQYMEAVLQPGMKSVVHRHSGPELWYTMSGETCLETPGGTLHGHAGGPPVIIPQGPPMELTATGRDVRRALVLVLYDSTQPYAMLASDWTPKGLCKP